MTNFTRIGIDLAKNTFSICAVDSNDKIVLERSLKRKDLLNFFVNITPCMVAMEAGSGAHHWARELTTLGHDARIMDPRFVIPYRTGGRGKKNDRNDARAICEAAGRPHTSMSRSEPTATAWQSSSESALQAAEPPSRRPYTKNKRTWGGDGQAPWRWPVRRRVVRVGRCRSA